MKKFNFSLIVIVVLVLFYGCARTYVVEKTTTTYPDGRVEVKEKPMTTASYHYPSNPRSFRSFPFYDNYNYNYNNYDGFGYSSNWNSYNIGYGGNSIGYSPRINYNGGTNRGHMGRSGRRR